MNQTTISGQDSTAALMTILRTAPGAASSTIPPGECTSSGEHASRHDHRIPAGLEEGYVTRRVVRLAHGRAGELGDSHPLGTRHHALHVDVLPVRFPDALVGRAGRVFLNQGEEPIAVEIVPPERERLEIGGAQKIDGLPYSRRQMRGGVTIVEPVDQHHVAI